MERTNDEEEAGAEQQHRQRQQDRPHVHQDHFEHFLNQPSLKAALVTGGPNVRTLNSKLFIFEMATNLNWCRWLMELLCGNVVVKLW